MLPTDSKFVYVDFEFNGTSEARLNLVCCCYHADGKDVYVWLHNKPENAEKLKQRLLKFRDDGYVFVAYGVEAEARSFIALGINPVKCQWIDLMIEYRMLINHNHKYGYGRQLIKGVEKTTSFLGKYSIDDGKPHDKPEYNLVACTYKILGIKRDQLHKNKMRDLIISAPDTFNDVDKKSILAYCKEDTDLLSSLLKEITKAILESYSNDIISVKYFSESLLRGGYAARTAMMVSLGYPINFDKLKRLSKAVPNILKECVEDILSQDLPVKMFSIHRKTGMISMNVKLIQDYILTTEHAKTWQRADKGAISLALEALEAKFSYKHNYPRGNVFAQLLRYMYLKKALKDMIYSNKRSIFDFLGSDKRIRPYFSIYGAQSGRSQPGSTSFIFLKTAWMRFLVSPSPGRSIVAIDYSSQEFLLAGILARDKAMVEAYKSGDVYLATKKTHGQVRDLFKTIVLSTQYGKTATSMKYDLTNISGKEWSQEATQRLIDIFFNCYPNYTKFNETNLKLYKIRKYSRLPCGWTMWGDNPNPRSVKNVPIQGAGASIMRKAVAFAQDAGLKVIFTLHDALYVEYDAHDLEVIDKLAFAMKQAVDFYYPGFGTVMRMDANTWGPDYVDGELTTPGGIKAKSQTIYIDPRAKNEYEMYSKYFNEETTS
jgi:DNA polymerase family A